MKFFPDRDPNYKAVASASNTPKQTKRMPLPFKLIHRNRCVTARTLPVGRARAVTRKLFLDRLPVTHRGWVNPAHQMFHSILLRVSNGMHQPVTGGDVVTDRGQTLQNRLPLLPIQLPQERP